LLVAIDFQPQRPHHLLAVYRDTATARRVADGIRRRFGVTPTVDAPLDERASLNAEMGEEMEHSFLAPQAGVVYSKESAKGLTLFTVLGSLIGLAVVVPITLAFADGLTTGARWATGIGIGLTFGATVGLVLGSLAAKRPNEPMAAEKGVTVRVPADADDLRTMLMEADPIRLDVVDDNDRPITTVTTDEKRTAREAGRKLGDRATHWP
jgi:hypothetical protein